MKVDVRPHGNVPRFRALEWFADIPVGDMVLAGIDHAREIQVAARQDRITAWRQQARTEFGLILAEKGVPPDALAELSVNLSIMNARERYVETLTSGRPDRPYLFHAYGVMPGALEVRAWALLSTGHWWGSTWPGWNTKRRGSAVRASSQFGRRRE